MAGIYVHVPFCERKCIYCDFYSIEDRSTTGSFLDALVAEIQEYAAPSKGTTFGSVFFGGGTPSLLEPEQLERIMRALTENYTIGRDAEVTLEANPGTVTKEKLRAYHSLGINRVSFGVQSFHEDELRFLGRIHDARQARDSVAEARAAGYSNVSIDIIFSLPGQDIPKLKSTLDEAMALGPDHISVYSLIIEAGTPLHRLVQSKQVTPLPPEDDADLYLFSMEYLMQHGYEHYEVSNYARPGFRSKHNSNYWNHTPYRGFGPSAHSFWEGKRWWNVASVGAYCSRITEGESAIAGREILDRNQLLEEAIFLGLRSDGIIIGHLTDRYGFRVTPRVTELLDRWKTDQLAVQSGDRLRLTSQGYCLCDELCTLLLSTESA